jgi:glutamate N-acetyltransferase/amino-acid N-acetyltransferase
MFPKGFRAAGVAANMRYKDRPDLGLIVADEFQAAAAVFTKNICQAAPVLWSRPRTTNGRAILVNAGQANAQSGPEGLEVCRRSAEAAGRLLGIEADQVLLASTGVIGQPVNIDALLGSMDRLVASLSTDGFHDFARAIMTTDKVSKIASIVHSDEPKTTIWGAVKGSGMIAPNMATMLGFFLTDAAVEPDFLQKALAAGAKDSFNRVIVDGDTSTNDSLFIIASGAAGGPLIGGDRSGEEFYRSMMLVMDVLAKEIALDAEGATRLVEIVVQGAENDLDARMAARTVAESPLVKTAFHGRDANWGRVMAALGRSGAEFDPYKVDLKLDTVPWVLGGRDNGHEEEAIKVMNRRQYRLTIDLHAGRGSHWTLACDLSPEYVSINGSYRS